MAARVLAPADGAAQPAFSSAYWSPALVELAHRRQHRLAVLLAERPADAADLDQLAHVCRAPAQNLFQHRVRGDGVGRLALRALPSPGPQPLELVRVHCRLGPPGGPPAGASGTACAPARPACGRRRRHSLEGRVGLAYIAAPAA